MVVVGRSGLSETKTISAQAGAGTGAELGKNHSNQVQTKVEKLKFSKKIFEPLLLREEQDGSLESEQESRFWNFQKWGQARIKNFEKLKNFSSQESVPF